MQDRFSREVTGMLSSGVLTFTDRIRLQRALLPAKKPEPERRRKTYARRYGQVLNNAVSIPLFSPDA
jgi:hypothetical protein